MGKVAMQTSSFISCEVPTENCYWLPPLLLQQSFAVICFLFGGTVLRLKGTAVRPQVRGGGWGGRCG